jgi:hypothetical protein
MTHISPGAAKVTFKRLKSKLREKATFNQWQMASTKPRLESKKVWKEFNNVFQGRDHISITVTAPEALRLCTFHIGFTALNCWHKTGESILS